MKQRLLNLSIFTISIMSLILSMKLFWNINIYVDEHNSNPAMVLGGNFWLNAYWIMMLLNLSIGILSFISLIKKK